MDINNFHSKLFKVEYNLWGYSQLPILNIVTGPGKALMGVVQAITAIALAILTAPLCKIRGCDTVFKAGLFNVVHGIGNLVSGVFLAIPIVGNVAAWYTVAVRGRQYLGYR